MFPDWGEIALHAELIIVSRTTGYDHAPFPFLPLPPERDV